MKLSPLEGSPTRSHILYAGCRGLGDSPGREARHPRRSRREGASGVESHGLRGGATGAGQATVSCRSGAHSVSFAVTAVDPIRSASRRLTTARNMGGFWCGLEHTGVGVHLRPPDGSRRERCQGRAARRAERARTDLTVAPRLWFADAPLSRSVHRPYHRGLFR